MAQRRPDHGRRLAGRRGTRSNGLNPEFQVVSTEGYDLITSVEQGADEFQVIVTFCEPYPDYEALVLGSSRRPSRSPTRRRSTPAGSARSTNDWMTGPFEVGTYDDAAGYRRAGAERHVVGRPRRCSTRSSSRSSARTPSPQAFANNELDCVRHRPRPQRLRPGVQHAGRRDPRRRRPELASRDDELRSQRWPDPGPGGAPGDPDVARPGRDRRVRPRRHPVAGEAARQPHLRRELAVLRRQLRPSGAPTTPTRRWRCSRRTAGSLGDDGVREKDGQRADTSASRSSSACRCRRTRRSSSRASSPRSASRSRSSTCRSQDFGNMLTPATSR